MNSALGALFDWDGIVIDSSAQHERSWEQLAQEIHQPLPDDSFRRGFGMKNQAIIPNILGWSQEPQEIEQLGQRKEEIYREMVLNEGIMPLPGVMSTLEFLQDRAVPCCIASSTPRQNIDFILDVIGVGQYFDAIVAAEDVSQGKPDPEVFLQSARRIKRPPGNCVVFEDALMGIQAGQAAGCKVIAVATTHSIGELGHADLALQSLDELSWKVFSSLMCREMA